MPKPKKKNTVPAAPETPPQRFTSYLWPALAALVLLVSLGLWFAQQYRDRPAAAVPPAAVAPTPVAVAPKPPAKATEPALSLVDEAQCQGCHTEQVKQWHGSHHQLAMQTASADSVLGDFADVRFRSDKETTRFFRQGEEFWVNTPGADGQPADFKVAYAFGIEPLQQYLIDTGNGHLQALGVAWDTQKKTWFHLYPGQGVDFKDPLHWSKPQQNANFMCVECHTTGFKRNFDANSGAYNSQWQALGVGCQSCHGPASAHLKWAEKPGEQANAGFTFSARSMTTEQQSETCGRCHARRAPLGDGFRSHMRLMDDYLPSVLTPLLNEIDGKIKEEVFEYGSFTQSKMFAKGVRCSDCHNPHSLQLRAEGNAVCTQCHNPSGTASRPGIDGSGLRAKLYDSIEHTGHKPGSPAAQCTSCHMPGKLYMVNDLRHDHSLSLPNPQRAASLGTPDACLNCHQDTAREKLFAQFQQRYPQPADAPPRYDQDLWLVRHGKPGAAEALLRQLRNPEQPAIRRATLLGEVGNYPSRALFEQVNNDLRNPQPLVRAAAIDAFTSMAPARVDALGPLLSDPVLAVRLAAAHALLGVPEAQQGQYAAAWQQAIGEYQQAQLSLRERAEANLNLAGLYAADGRAGNIEASLREAILRDGDFFPAQVSLAQWLEENFRKDEARQLLREALDAHPDQALLQHAWGLTLIREGNRQAALQALKEAARLEPDNRQYGYVLAIALNDSGQADAARAQLAALLKRQPGNRNVRLALVGYSLQTGNAELAQQLLQELQQMNPDDPYLHQGAGG